MAEVRTFVAIELPEEVRRQIEMVQAILKEAQAPVKWVEPKNVHITLKFIGEIPEERLEPLFQGVQSGLKGAGPFYLKLSGIGAFPNLKRPRVIWIGVNRGKEELVRLQQSVERNICAHGFPQEEREFSPHLTIGRVKSLWGLADLVRRIKTVEFVSGDIIVEGVVVVRSDLTPQGPIYTTLKKYLLSGRR